MKREKKSPRSRTSRGGAHTRAHAAEPNERNRRSSREGAGSLVVRWRRGRERAGQQLWLGHDDRPARSWLGECGRGLLRRGVARRTTGTIEDASSGSDAPTLDVPLAPGVLLGETHQHRCERERSQGGRFSAVGGPRARQNVREGERANEPSIVSGGLLVPVAGESPVSSSNTTAAALSPRSTRN